MRGSHEQRAHIHTYIIEIADLNVARTFPTSKVYFESTNKGAIPLGTTNTALGPQTPHCATPNTFSNQNDMPQTFLPQ
jgi:hypothetical protein